MSDKYFVMIAGLRGPQPQIWNGLQQDGGGKVKPTLLLKRLEGNQLNMNLDELRQEFASEIAGLQSNS